MFKKEGRKEMLTRYRVRNDAMLVDEYGNLSMTADTVYDSDDSSFATGLVDQYGEAIVRERVRFPIGFKLTGNTT